MEKKHNYIIACRFFEIKQHQNYDILSWSIIILIYYLITQFSESIQSMIGPLVSILTKSLRWPSNLHFWLSKHSNWNQLCIKTMQRAALEGMCCVTYHCFLHVPCLQFENMIKVLNVQVVCFLHIIFNSLIILCVICRCLKINIGQMVTARNMYDCSVTHQVASLKPGAGWYRQRPWWPGNFHSSTTDCLEKSLVYFGELNISNTGTETQYTHTHGQK